MSHITQYADADGEWHDVRFSTGVAEVSPDIKKGILQIANCSGDFGRQPKYYSQFTVSRISGGFPELMEFDDFESLESINERRQPLQEGQYMLVTGQRLADGSVLARTTFFEVAADQESRPELIMRQDSSALQVIGNLDAELPYTPFTPGADISALPAPRSILSATGRGYYALGLILPGHEPSAHALNDIAAAANDISAAGCKVLLLFPDAEGASRFRVEDFGTLPENVVFGIDTGGVIAEALKAGLELPSLTDSDMPIFVVADSFNRIITLRKGYTIHLGEQLARILTAASAN